MTSPDHAERSETVQRGAALALLRPLAALLEQDEEARSLRVVRRGDRLYARLSSADGAAVPAPLSRAFDLYALDSLGDALRRLADSAKPSFRVAIEPSFRVDVLASGSVADSARVDAIIVARMDATKRPSLDGLVAEKLLTEEQAKKLRTALSLRQGILIGGPSASGKTALLRALAAEAALNGEIVAACERSGEAVAGWNRDAEPPLTVEPERLAEAIAHARPGCVVAGDLIDGADALRVLLAAAGSGAALLASLELGPRADAAGRVDSLVALEAARLGLRLPERFAASAFSLHASMGRGDDGPRLKDLLAIAR